jgi:predicted RNA-binding protein
MNYWMVTISEGNFTVTRQQGWRVQGFTSRQRRKTDRMQPGDRLLFYVKEPRGFALAATITSPAFAEQTPLWRYHRPEETFPHRVRIRPDAVLPQGGYIDANQIAPRLEYLRRWLPEQWLLAFDGELHMLPRRDFDLIEEEMHRQHRRPRADAPVPQVAPDGGSQPGGPESPLAGTPTDLG